tara:strand:+ start:3889 stop:5001 length:1113 start_codon:yes stop_codon:yes gene_type:complete
MPIIVAGHRLNTAEGIDKITSTDKVTSAYFSDSAVQLNSTDIHSASISNTNEVYYYGIAKGTTTGSVQFDVTYGNSLGYGGDSDTDNIKSPTEVIYKHWANVLLAENEVTGGFVMSSLGSVSAVASGKDTEIYVLNARRSLMKDRLNKKNWTLILSGSDVAGIAGKRLTLTDDSATVAATATPAGPRYSIVSGSQGTVHTSASGTTYGWFYPDQGALVFSGAELSKSIGGVDAQTATVVTYNTATMRGFGSAGNAGNVLEDTDYNTALRFINCLKVPGASLKFRDEEDLTSVSYFCRVRAGEANFSNNPTFVSGSLNELRNETMKGNPTVYISGVELFDTTGNVVAVGKLSTPLKKNFASEATIKVKLTY